MEIFKKNKSVLPVNGDYEFINGIEFIIKRALNNGIRNVFLDGGLSYRLPEIIIPSFLTIRTDLDFLWTSVYSLSVTNRRVMGFAYDGSFFNFINLEKYFTGNKNLDGGVVLFLFKKKGMEKFSFSFKSVFPIYNYYKISDFLDYLPYYFELSEKIKLPVLIYLNDSVMYEYNPDEKKEYTERTAAKQRISFGNGGGISFPSDIKLDMSLYKNTGGRIKLFKGNNPHSLILTDANHFDRIIEDKEIKEDYDIILFNLLNPVDSSGFAELIKNGCKDFYKNIYIFDDYGLLYRQIEDILKGGVILLKYKDLKLVEEKNIDKTAFGFCLDDFKITETDASSNFCPGCTLFTFLHVLEKKIDSPENCILIGEEGCFSLLASSALKFSFQHILITEEPLYFSFNLNPKDLNKTFFVFIPSFKFSENIDKFIEINSNSDFKDRTVFIIYRTIYDLNFNMESLVSHALLKSFKKVSFKKNARLKVLGGGYGNAPLIFLDNDCDNFAKSGRNLDYSAYLAINNKICDKFECRLCYQKTKCSAIKIKTDENLTIDAEICNLCKLCLDICPHNAVKLKKRKKIKIKKSLESKINF